ncbi:MAG: hypothetical protein MUF12_07025 [Sediminibacterium sp.]|jgi:hypothetical protein|nr:hypothetical protein [Sediminibacterium sp.]
MKNIHSITTNKQTGIFQSNSGFQFSIRDKVRVEPLKGFHIYITNDEKIRDGNWYLFNVGYASGIKKADKRDIEQIHLEIEPKKIILTTDQDLIKDGVQAIDDEFLEWFVKNPSCEFVEVEEKNNNEILIELDGYHHDEGLLESDYQQWLKDGGQLYKIIIPKEENKVLSKLEIAKNIAAIGISKKEPKETLEEAAKNSDKSKCKHFRREHTREEVYDSFEEGFIAGAKWQQETAIGKETLEDKLKKLDILYKEIILGFEDLLNDESIIVDKPNARRLYAFKHDFETKQRNYNTKINGNVMNDIINTVKYIKSKKNEKL